MRAPAFWWDARPGWAARLLAPIGSLYGAATLSRMAQTGESAECPVICIGNPVAGGAGKTPTAMAVADILSEIGIAPAFLTRGYGGRLAGPLRVDRAAHSAAEVGDEALLLAQRARTVLARDRAAGARLAVQSGAGAIVMDDGFQNPALAKDLSLLVVDAAVGIGNACVLPAGPLRAPIEDQLARAHGLVLIGDGAAGESVRARALAHGLPVHRARIEIERGSAAGFERQRVLAFSGIGRPEKFAASLKQAGAEIVAHRWFGDHHPFTQSEAAELLAEAERKGLLLATTAKDHARLAGAEGEALGRLAGAARVLDITLVFEDRGALRAQIEAALSARERARAP